MHHTPCPRREPSNPAAWCPTCLADLARSLADDDVPLLDDLDFDALAVVLEAIVEHLCPACQRVAVVELHEIWGAITEGSNEA